MSVPARSFAARIRYLISMSCQSRHSDPMHTNSLHPYANRNTWHIADSMVAIILGTALFASPVKAEEPVAIVGELKVVPETMVLHGRRDRHSLLVLGQSAAGLATDLTS